jgi:predicted nucleic acid-binding protein
VPTLVDTSVLLRLRDPASPAHAACRAALDPAQIARHGICLCAQVLIEYWVVATRPAERNGFGLTPAEAAGDLASLLGMLPCLDEPPDIAKRWLARVANYQVAGKPAHDARLVAWMEAHGIRRLLTLNPSDFVRYPDVEVVLPSVLLTAGPT